MNNYNMSKYTKMKQEKREKEKKELESFNDKIYRIKNYAVKTKIEYPEYKEAYDYVDKLFPQINIKNVVIYRVNGEYLAKLGFGSAGGFYVKSSKMIVLSSLAGSFRKKIRYNPRDICAKITKDEVIVHELIHYCFNQKDICKDSDQHEEFAYGWSIGYLREKGYSDEEIIKNNFLPYLYNSVGNKIFSNILANHNIKLNEYNQYSAQKKNRVKREFGKEFHEKALKKSYEIGHQLIDIYSRKMSGEQKEVEKKKSRFDFLDLEP